MANAILNFHFDFPHPSLSWTPPLDPWFLWQCFEWNRVNDNLSIVNACHSSLSQITIAHCSFMAVWYPSSISIFNVHIIPLFIVCLSAWVTFLLLHKFLPSLPPLKNSWIFLFTTWLPIFGPAAAFPQRVRALKNVKDILQLLHLSRRQQSRHDLFGRFCMRQDQWQNNSCLLVLHKERLSRQLRILQAVSASWTPVTLLWLCSQLDRIQI